MVTAFYLGQAGFWLGHTHHDERASNRARKIPQGLAKWHSSCGRQPDHMSFWTLTPSLCLENLQHLSHSRLIRGQHSGAMLLSHTNSKYLMFAIIYSQGSDAKCISVWGGKKEKRIVCVTKWDFCIL